MHTEFHLERTTCTLALVACAIGACALGGDACAAVGTASAGATVIAPLMVAKTADLSFGRFATGAGGSVTISTSGVRTVSGGIVTSADSGAMTAATFVVSGEKGAAYSVTHGGTTTLARNAGSETMVLTKFSDFTAANAINGTAASGTLNAGTQSIYVGGTLAVAPNQPAGDYSGVVTVTVEYN